MSDWRGWSAGQWALRAVVLLGPVVAVLVRWPVGGRPSGWLVLLTVGVALGWALAAESMAGAVALLVAGFSWAPVLDRGLPAVLLLAAAAMFAAHVAALLVSYGPGRLPVDRALALLWLRRAALAFLTAPAVWLVARSALRLPEREIASEVWVAGLVVALSVTLVAVAAVRAALPPED